MHEDLQTRLFDGAPEWLRDAASALNLTLGEASAFRALADHADHNVAVRTISQVRADSARIAGDPRWWRGDQDVRAALNRLAEVGLVEVHRTPGQTNAYRLAQSAPMLSARDHAVLEAELNALAAVRALAGLVGHRRAGKVLEACLSASWHTPRLGDRRRP